VGSHFAVVMVLLCIYSAILGTKVELFNALQQFSKPLILLSVHQRGLDTALRLLVCLCSGRKRQADDILLGDGEAEIVLACSFHDSSGDLQNVHFSPSVPPLSKVDAQLQVVRKLEEKEHLLQSSIGTGEKELGLRTQALEMNKRKVSDCLISSWIVRRSCCLVGSIESS